jgi:hypothetical protein
MVDNRLTLESEKGQVQSFVNNRRPFDRLQRNASERLSFFE